ncbi:hypothetical protein [Verrucomicrobium sp. BvORR106]|uniref:beta strand repeat-containing protein n=1 Tax=Verrucomicrobium sp. BvORR106 TaxID=1403819 RepID=UPI002240EAD6|nr:hypothetical protein [Verrucomicrobium sp. BvORR106]
MPSRFVVVLSILSLLPASLYSDTIVAKGSGNWHDPLIWDPEFRPMTGTNGSDSVLIGTDENGVARIVTWVGGTAGGVGNVNYTNGASADFGVDNGNTITVDGGILAHTKGTNWVRIGNWGEGTLDIKDGKVFFPVGEVQIGTHGTSANGIVRIGDGTGAAGSAVMNLWATADGNWSGQTTTLNLGKQQNNTFYGSAGFLTIESDGLLEGGAHTTTSNGTGGWNYNQSVTRIGYYPSAVESVLLIKAGGRFNAHGTVEMGSSGILNGMTSKGLLHLDGEGALMTLDFGEFNIGRDGVGRMIIENSAQFIKSTNALDATSGVIPKGFGNNLGRAASGVGTLTIRTNGKFIRDTGGNVGDLYIGASGQGTIYIETGGELINRSTNWDWLGVAAGSVGKVYVSSGGLYSVVTTAQIVVGRDAANATLGAATGLIEINGGSMVSNGDVHIGQDGNGTLRLISGRAEMLKLSMGRGAGNGLVEVQGGEMLIKGNSYIGGDTGDYSANTSLGTATFNQSGGIVTATNAISIGLGTNHTGTVNITGGEFYHKISDVSVGEKGAGYLYIGKDAKFYEQATASDAYLFVGRLNGSQGTMIVDGYLEKQNASVRVGHGNDAAGSENNTTGRGTLGGSGTIKSLGGVYIGSYGTITGGTMTSVGALTIQGNLNLVTNTGAPSQSTLFVNFDRSSPMGADRIIVTGEIYVDGARIDGTWGGGDTGLESRYWIVVSDTGLGLSDFFTNMVWDSDHYLASDYWNMGADGFVNIGGMDFAMFYGADFDTGALTGGNDLMLSAMGAVPEPGISSLAFLGFTCLFMRRRRTRR